MGTFHDSNRGTATRIRDPQLLQIEAELFAGSARAEKLCSGLDESELAWRPSTRGWSVAECLEHLTVTTAVFLPGLDEAIERAQAKRQVSCGPYELGRWGRLLVWYVEPPPAIRLPAPRPLRPTLQGAVTEVLPRFLRSQNEILDRLPQLEGIDLARATYISPIARYIRMNLLAFLRVHTAHERRHLWQAERVVAAIPD
jgi:hypothetical protein